MARNVGLKTPYEPVWERVKQITGWKKDNELALFLEVKPGTVSGAKQRDSFPIQWAFKIAQDFESNTDWLMTGEGPMKSGEAAQGDENLQGLKRRREDKFVDKFLMELDNRLMSLEKEDPGYRAWFRIECKKRFPELFGEKKRAGAEVSEGLAKQNVA